jgi:hypothetical protein
LSHSASLLLYWVFQDRVSTTICLGLALNLDPPDLSLFFFFVLFSSSWSLLTEWLGLQAQCPAWGFSLRNFILFNSSWLCQHLLFVLAGMKTHIFWE